LENHRLLLEDASHSTFGKECWLFRGQQGGRRGGELRRKQLNDINAIKKKTKAKTNS